MKINSMEANFRPAVNIEPLQASQSKRNAPEQIDSLIVVKNQDVAFQNTNDSKDEIATEDKISDAFLERSIDKVNQTFEIHRRSVRFRIHEKTNEVMVKIVDADTEEVIREIPPEKLLDMFANMLELAGLLVDERR